MGRDALLTQKREYDEAFKELKQKYKAPAAIKYELQNESGSSFGSVEYRPHDDTIAIVVPGSPHAVFSGTVIRSLRDALNKILDE